jgi:hypothetical protein
VDNDDLYDTTRPFLAICMESQGSNRVYFVNPTGDRLDGVETTTGGFFSAEHEVLAASGGGPKQWTVAPHSAICIERTGDDEFARLVIWWSVTYTMRGERTTVNFATDKHLYDALHCERLPVLGKPGLIARRSGASRGTSETCRNPCGE